jgi:NADH-quinone oxidoreductase subunit E
VTTATFPPEVDLRPLQTILARYPQERRSLIMVLQDAQASYGYLPRPVMVQVATALGVPKSHVFHVATFYKAFSLTPRGRHTWTVCMGTACHVRGAQLLTEHLERTLEVQAGETTADGEFSLETVNCVGACALGPLAIVDDTYLGGATTTTIDRALRKMRPAPSRPSNGEEGDE